MAESEELKQDFHDAHEVCRTGWSNFLPQATTDLDYYFRAQHTEDEAKRADEQGRDLFTIDKIGRQVNLLHGYEIRNRHILKITPSGSIEMGEDLACGQHTKVIMNLMSRDGYDVLSDAFKWGTLVQGSNLVEIWRDRNGDLQFSRLGWNQFLLNPGLTRTDLSDCRDIITGRWVDSDVCKFLLPSSADDIDEINPVVISSRWDFLGTPPLANKEGRRLYEEWWRRETDYQDIVISRKTGQEVPFKAFTERFYNKDEKQARRSIKELKLPDGSPALSKYSRPVDKIRLTIFVDEKMVWDGLNPLKMRDYNFIWFHGDFCAESPRDELKLQSFVRRLRDPQRALNRRTNQIYDLIESQIQGLRIVRDKHLMNPEDAYRSGQGVVLHANEDTPDEMALDQLIRQIPASEVPNSLFQALEMTDKAETDTGGLNQEIFGSDDKDNVPAILGKFRTGQALTGQQWMFQGFRGSKRQVGIKLLKLVQLNYSPDKIKQLINEIPVPGFYNGDLSKYDCTPVEGLLTDSQQQLFYLELKTLRMEFEDAKGMIPLSVLVKYSPTPFRKELIEIIQQAEQAQQQAQKQMAEAQQRQDKLTEAVTATQVARTMEDTANAMESRADAQFTRAKTLTEMQKIRNDSLLGFVKEAVKLEMAKMSQNTIGQNQGAR